MNFEKLVNSMLEKNLHGRLIQCFLESKKKFKFRIGGDFEYILNEDDEKILEQLFEDAFNRGYVEVFDYWKRNSVEWIRVIGPLYEKNRKNLEKASIQRKMKEIEEKVLFYKEKIEEYKKELEKLETAHAVSNFIFFNLFPDDFPFSLKYVL